MTWIKLQVSKNTLSNITLHAKITDSIFIVVIGLILCVIYETDTIPPIIITLALFTAVLAYLFKRKYPDNNMYLYKILIVFYALPFIHLYPYMWFSPIDTPRQLWGMTANPYQLEMNIIERLSLIAVIGLLGLLLGFIVGYGGKTARTSVEMSKERTMGLVSFIFMTALSMLFQWLHTPKYTIFDVPYAVNDNPVLIEGVNFNGAWLISHMMALLLYLDYVKEASPICAEIKKYCIYFLYFILIVVFQLLRGNRECFGLILSVLALELIRRDSRVNENGNKYRFRWSLVIPALFVAFVAMQFVGKVRQDAFNKTLVERAAEENINVDWFLTGTWSAVLLTPLSIVGDVYYGLSAPRCGDTYVDLFKSLPPGIVTQYLGYERPFETYQGPAWEMRYGQGGTHLLVVPFMNFRSFGVFVILTMIGAIIAYVERKNVRERSVGTTYLYMSIIYILPHWVWYGDMNLIRSIIAYCILLIVYKISLVIRI